MADPVLASMVRAIGQDKVPSQSNRPPKVNEYNQRWVENGKHRDGPVNAQRVELSDQAAMTAQIKAKAAELGADLVGICRLQPSMINLGEVVAHEYVIAACVHEDYDKVLAGHEAVHEEAMRVYATVSTIATQLAATIRDLRYPALAHHNGGGENQVGFGGSLINEKYGANF